MIDYTGTPGYRGEGGDITFCPGTPKNIRKYNLFWVLAMILTDLFHFTLTFFLKKKSVRKSSWKMYDKKSVRAQPTPQNSMARRVDFARVRRQRSTRAQPTPPNSMARRVDFARVRRRGKKARNYKEL